MPMTISMDDELKSEFSAVCKEIGLSPSTAINIFARAVVREKGIPFKLTAVDVPSAQSQEEYEAICRNYFNHLTQELTRAYEEIKQGHYVTEEELEAGWEAAQQKRTSL